MLRFAIFTGIAALLFCGAIFGFFFAWVCSTLWGLDTLPPNAAIAAMQAMNASVRNGVFAPAFFGTPCVALLAGVLFWSAGARGAAFAFIAAALVYLGGGIVLTMAVHVPMNEVLAQVTLPQADAEASAIWNAYSASWQQWNITRTVFSGAALLLAAIGLYLGGVVAGTRKRA